MSDQNTQVQGQDQGTEATPVPVKLFPTKDEALAAKPDGAAKSVKPFEVSKGGAVVGWVLGRGYDHALAMVARLGGYTVSLGGNTQPVTKEAVAAKLTEFTDDELAAMGLSRKPQKGGKK
jgi:hypothetical protein